MLHRLQRDNALFLRVYAKCLELLQIHHLPCQACDKDLDTVDPDDQARTKAAGQAAKDGPVSGKVPV